MALFDAVGSVQRRKPISTVPGRASAPHMKEPPVIGRSPGAVTMHGRPYGSMATGGNTSGLMMQPGMEGAAMGLQGTMAHMMGGGGGIPNMNLLRRAGYGGLPFMGGGGGIGGSAGGY